MQNEKDGAPAKVEIVSGIRATGSLTIGNYVGAVKQFIELQDAGHHSLIFVADLHVLTDREPDVAIKYRKELFQTTLGLAWIRIDATFSSNRRLLPRYLL